VRERQGGGHTHGEKMAAPIGGHIHLWPSWGKRQRIKGKKKKAPSLDGGSGFPCAARAHERKSTEEQKNGPTGYGASLCLVSTGSGTTWGDAAMRTVERWCNTVIGPT